MTCKLEVNIKVLFMQLTWKNKRNKVFALFILFVWFMHYYTVWIVCTNGLHLTRPAVGLFAVTVVTAVLSAGRTVCRLLHCWPGSGPYLVEVSLQDPVML